MPKLDPAFRDFMKCRDQGAAERWLDGEIGFYMANDPLKEKRETPLTYEMARQQVIGHLAFNAGYCGKDVVDQVHRFFGEEAFSMGATPQYGTRPLPPERTRLEMIDITWRRLKAWIRRKL